MYWVENICGSTLDAGGGDKKQPWEMTADEYVESTTTKGEYADEYKELTDREMAGVRKDRQNTYIREVEKHIASGGVVSEAVADSIYAIDKDRAWQVIRPAIASGAMEWVVPDARDYRLTYRQFLDYMNRDGVRIGSIRGMHRGIVQRAIREGKPVPANVLAEYPDIQQQMAD